jgi:ATP-dependent Clp protease ATP-binding subunit ClpA
MAISLDALIAEVEQRAPSTEPLALLATASATANELSETTDAVLSHFVDRSRRAGHSWSEIGEALGVTKQAVQKRFTGERRNPRGFEKFTPRAVRAVSHFAEEAAKELRQPSIGTEALLLGLFGDKRSLAAKALKDRGITRAKAVAAIDAVLPRGPGYREGYTPLAWEILESCANVAFAMGHNYVGTEHVLIALMSGPETSIAVQALVGLGVAEGPVVQYVTKVLNGISS